LPKDFFEAIESLRVHVQQKIIFIVSAQVFDKEDCAGVYRRYCPVVFEDQILGV
jgi:hypothetical protein